jgi:hypothetical protein
VTEKVKEMLHQTTRTWYGVPVDITVSSDHWHRVVVPGLTLPHPGLVNLFARWGLPADERLVLTYRHELGHLQTLPVPLAHLFLILWPRRGRRGGSRWLRALVGFVAHQAVWELAAESYVVTTARYDRRRSRSTAGRAIYAILWSGMAFLVAAGTAFLMLREASPPPTGS